MSRVANKIYNSFKKDKNNFQNCFFEFDINQLFM